jgi:penicillin-binding protein 2
LPPDQHAAIALIDVESGDTLCMAWLPESNVDEEGRTWVLYQNLAATFRKTATIGSVFKPFVAIDALESGLEIEYRECPNEVEVGRKVIRCRHYVPNIPPTFLYEEAILHSCNAFFVKIGVELGTHDFERIARRFGLATDGPIHPALGLEISQNGWRPGERFGARRAIGYGIWAAPLSLARAYAGIATGQLPPYRLVRSIGGEPVAPGKRVELGISQRHLDRVRNGLVETVDPLGHGTARKTRLHEFRVAAKTGSPELGTTSKRNNAWLCGYFPHRRPRFAFAAVFFSVPDQVHGGDVAAAAVYDLLAGMAQMPEYAEAVLQGTPLK